MGSTRPTAIVLTWAPLPTTKLLTTAFLKSPLAADDGHQIHELNSTSDSSLKNILSSDGMLICAGSLARVAHLLGPNQKRFFDATEDSFLFRTLVGDSYPEYICHKSSDPWAVKLDWDGGRRKYVIKPNVGYSSIDTFIVNNAEEQEEVRSFEVEANVGRGRSQRILRNSNSRCFSHRLAPFVVAAADIDHTIRSLVHNRRIHRWRIPLLRHSGG